MNSRIYTRRAAVLALLTWVASVSVASAQVDNVDVGGTTYTILQQEGGTRYAALVPAGGTERFDVVIMGDGYTLDDQERLRTAAIQFTEQLLSIAPFSDLGCALNVWLVQLVSVDSGIDEPARGIERNTALDARFAEPGEYSMLVTASYERCLQAWEASGLPNYDLIYVIINDVDGLDGSWADSSDDFICSSDLYPWGTVMAHEIGHKVANLADEYRCYRCDGTFEGTGSYPFSEVLNPNLSLVADRASLPWGDLVLGSTGLPTTPDGAWTGSQTGAWEGGGYYRTGIYRPEEYCIMDGVTNVSEPFCRVCRRLLYKALHTYCSP